MVVRDIPRLNVHWRLIGEVAHYLNLPAWLISGTQTCPLVQVCSAFIPGLG